MAAAVNGATTRIGDFPPMMILCPVCQKPYKDPKVLPCLHSFCEQCLEDSLAKSNIGPGQAFLCPICHSEAVVPKRGVSAMQNNIFLETVAEFQLKKTGKGKYQVEIGPGPRKCEGCDTRAPASMKCIECDDWLCSRCCNMHNKVKLTREHHLVTEADLLSGEYDDILKGTFDTLVCAKHDEPLKLYCTEPSCLTPICTVCKTTLGHEGHHAVELSEQSRKDSEYVRALNENVEKSIEGIYQKVNNIKIEEQITIKFLKDIHKEINDRMAYLIDKIVKQITAHAESLHQEVDMITRKHKQELTLAAEECRYRLRAMKDARQFASCLTDFGRSEEVVAMSKVTTTRLNEFQVVIEIEAPPWRQPRLYPSQEFTDEEIARMFGRLTFQGEMVKSVCTSSFTIEAPGDERPVAISDMSLTEEDDIIVCDRDNRRIKVFDTKGELQFATNEGEFKAPNRVTALKTDGNVLVKDDKALKILRPDGIIVGQFAFHLNHPVGACQTPGGDILITDWQSGTVHALTESGEELYTFNTSLEAPAFINSTLYGRVVISDWKNHIVRVYSKQGKVLAQYGGNGEGALEGQLNHPYGVATDMFGRIIVADNWNHRVTLLEDDGRFLRHLVTKEDGLEWPQQVCVDSKGRLIVAELNGKIRVYQYMA